MIPMNAVALPRLQIVILCAGFSSRLGQPKALARVRSLSLLRRTLLLAERALPADVVVVVPRRAERYRVEARRIKVTFVANARRAQGLSSSVRRGMAQARYSPALLILPVDLIALQSRDLARLISRWRASRRCVVATRVGTKDGKPQGGVPLILPRWLYPKALTVTGDIGLRGLVGSLSPPQRILVDLPSTAMDVDTRQDLNNARQRRHHSGVSL